MKDYYKGGKRVMIDGVPCKVAKWVTRSMLRQMRESPVTSWRRAKEQAEAGWLK